MEFTGDKSEEQKLKGSASTHFAEPLLKSLDDIESEELTWSEAEEQKARPLTYTRKVRCGLIELICTVTNEGRAVEKWIEGQSNVTTFGLDTEWKPNLVSDKNRVALLQISSQTECLLVQLLHLDYIPDSFRNFLQSGTNFFGDVGITEDGMKLDRDHGLVCAGLVELQQYCNHSGNPISLWNFVLLVFNTTMKRTERSL